MPARFAVARASVLRRYARPVTRRQLFLHVGSSKTGTSALQLALWSSVDAVAADGLGLPLVGRGANVRRLLRPLGWVAATGFVGDLDPAGLEQLTQRLRATPGERLLISNEDLAEAEDRHVAAVMDAAHAADLDVRVVVTARDWAKQLPSEWQQLLKHRLTTDYETFLDLVRERRGLEGETFWRRQDFLGVCERWGSRLDPADVHLVPVPAAAVDPDAVFRVFSELVGIDPAVLVRDPRNVNLSFGQVEAEMLRRLNLALGPRLEDYEKEYLPAVRRVLVRRVMARGQAPRITLPPEHVPWVREATQQLLRGVLDRGYTVHGDHDLLVPAASAGVPMPPVDETDLANATIKTLADFAVAVHEEAPRVRARAARQALRKAAGPRGGQPEDTPTEVGFTERLIRRWRS